MGRTARKRDLPHPPPVQRIELSPKHVGLRVAAAALLLLIGAGALAYAFTNLVAPQDGWQEIEVSASAGEVSCGEDFVLNYNIGAGGTGASAEARALTALYSRASVHAYQLFDTVQSWDGVVDLYDLNHHPNEVMEVEDTLYRAFELLEQYDSRALYLGPVYAVYQSLFYCEDDGTAENFDPFVNEEMAAYVAEGAAFARDADAVRLELLGDGRVRLNVSEDYLAWAEYNEVTCFLDFFWLKNAFVADYLADTLAEAGYTNGVLSSYDGYTRNLDGSGAPYSLNLYDLAEGSPLLAAVMGYTGPASIVYLRSFPAGEQDGYRFYQRGDGQLRTPYIDPADGLCRTSLPVLICWSRTAGCAETALQMAPAYVADRFDPAPLEALAKEDIWSVWCQDRVIHSNGPDASFTDVYDVNGVTYTLAG